MWKDMNVPLFQATCDHVLSKIKVPFHLLQTNTGLSNSELRLQINTYCEEIIHALKCADKAAIPVKKVRSNTEKSSWSNNTSLINACSSAKWSWRLWIECGRPRLVVLNFVRLFTKKRYRKVLEEHLAAIKTGNAKKVPQSLWSGLVKLCILAMVSNVCQIRKGSSILKINF